MLKKMVVLGAGGTIAGTSASADDNVGYSAGQIDVNVLLAANPLLGRVMAGHIVVAEQVLQLDSKDMDMSHLQLLCGRVAHHLSFPEVA